MKIAFPTNGSDLSAALEVRFGRAPRFLLFESKSGTFELIDNAQNMSAAQGAGIQAAQCVVEAGAEVLILRHCGPKAFHVLSSAAVEVYLTEAKTVAEALEQYQAGKLTKSATSNVTGHW